MCSSDLQTPPLRMGQATRLVYEVPLWWQIAAVPVGLAAAILVYWFRVRRPATPVPEAEPDGMVLDEAEEVTR